MMDQDTMFKCQHWHTRLKKLKSLSEPVTADNAHLYLDYKIQKALLDGAHWTALLNLMNDYLAVTEGQAAKRMNSQLEPVIIPLDDERRFYEIIATARARTRFTPGASPGGVRDGSDSGDGDRSDV